MFRLNWIRHSRINFQVTPLGMRPQRINLNFPQTSIVGIMPLISHAIVIGSGTEPHLLPAIARHGLPGSHMLRSVCRCRITRDSHDGAHFGTYCRQSARNSAVHGETTPNPALATSCSSPDDQSGRRLENDHSFSKGHRKLSFDCVSARWHFAQNACSRSLLQRVLRVQRGYFERGYIGRHQSARPKEFFAPRKKFQEVFLLHVKDLGILVAHLAHGSTFLRGFRRQPDGNAPGPAEPWVIPVALIKDAMLTSLYRSTVSETLGLRFLLP